MNITYSWDLLLATGMDFKFQVAWFYFCIINQFQASSTFNSCDELTRFSYSVEVLFSFTKLLDVCTCILEVSLI